MKRTLRSFAVGLLLGGLVGLWCGMNIGKGQPLLSNPFADVSLSQQASRAGRDVYESAERASREAGEAAQAAGREVRDSAESATQ
ncbi:MAG: hypothetical protein WD382_10905 [Halofilum sp. (in: g-proteobacteria)]